MSDNKEQERIDYVKDKVKVNWNPVKIASRAQARAYHWAYEHKEKGCWCGR